MKHKEKMREIFELVEEKKWERDAVAAACLQHRGACLLLSRKNPIHKQDLKTGDGDWFPERCVCVLYCVYVCEHRIEGKEDMEQEWVWAVEKTQCIPMRVMIWSEWMCRACVCVCLFLYINCTAIVHTTQCCRGIETNSDTALYICGSTFSLTPQPHNDRQMWSQTWGGSNLQPDLNSSSLFASFTLPFQIVIPLPTTVTIFSAAANPSRLTAVQTPTLSWLPSSGQLESDICLRRGGESVALQVEKGVIKNG